MALSERGIEECVDSPVAVRSSDTAVLSAVEILTYRTDPSAFFSYEDFAAQQLPWLWLPNQDTVYVYKKNLAGFTPASPFDFTLNPEVWYYVKPAS